MPSNTLTMNKPFPVSLLDVSAHREVGLPRDRVDGPRKVSGLATYAAEYGEADGLANMAYGYLVGAKVGRGKVVSVGADKVLDLPGVIDVVTDFDTFLKVPQQGGETGAPTQGVRDVEYFGEVIAIVVAESYEAARDAALQLDVAYETKPGVYDFEAHKSETITPPFNNIPAKYDQGDFDKAMDEAEVTVDFTVVTPSQSSAAMEPHASTAVWGEDGRLTVYGAYQMPTSDAQQLAKSLGVSASKVRIVARYIGGGFGSKLGIAPETVAAAIAAKKLGRPVKAVMARQQVFETTVRRSNTEQRMRLGATRDGRITAMAHDTIVSNLEGEGYFEPAGISTHFLYGGENRRITHELVELNLLLSGSMRAPGEAVGMLAIEGAMDALADELGMDPIEVRRVNEPEQDPQKGVPFSSRQLTRALDEGAERFGWDKRNAVPGSRREGEWLIGMGVSSAARGNMLMQSSAKVSIAADGSVTVASAMTDIGTGSYTILTQIASELLGVPADNVTVTLGDTDDPPAAGSGGSWGAASAGSAVYLACEKLREGLADAMGVPFDELTLKDGTAIGANRQVPIGELVGKGVEAVGTINPGQQEQKFRQAGFGAHFAEVAVNAVTGETRVRRMLGVFAAGRILNAKTARSQCLGGMTFGIGTALHEDLVHDKRNGKLVNHDLGEYHVPVNLDVPQMDVHFLDEHDEHANPINAKGIGELGIAGAAAAVAAAIHNATGYRPTSFPVTCDKLLDVLPAV